MGISAARVKWVKVVGEEPDRPLAETLESASGEKK